MEKTANIREKLKLKDFKLNTLLEVTKAINNNRSRKQLLSIFKEIVIDELKIGKILLFTYNNRWHPVVKYGIYKPKRINVKKDLSPYEEITFLNTAQNPHLKPFDVLIPVYHKSRPLAYLLLGDFAGERIEVSPIIKHMKFIQTLTNIIIVAIENKRLFNDNLKQAAVKKELEVASQMQSMLFPSVLPDNKYLNAGSYYKPHSEVGGDYYDFIQKNENEVFFCMADVSGKGVSAALLMSNFQANLRALVNYTSALHELVPELNEKIFHNAKGEKFITFFIAKYNTITKTLHYINAGHNPPVFQTNNTYKLLKTGTTVLGGFKELPEINEGIINVSPGSMMMCYTDGLVELTDEKNREFGVEGLISIMQKKPENSVDDLIQDILKKVRQHKGRRPYKDDVALLGFRFH